MAILFIDTTYKTSLGLLDDNLDWLAFKTFEDQKASSFIQNEIFNICNENNLKFKNLEAVINLAGPGFYTGLRVSEGLADVCEYFGIKKNSFYSYDIPKFLGVNEGVWITKAYRGEYFIHSWKGELETNDLINVKDFQISSFDNKQLYTHNKESLDFVVDSRHTLELLKDNSNLVFENVLRLDHKKEVFYFRAPEDEFRMNP